ncbi:Fe2+/Zn2+ uptake regulation protein [Halobacteroides halobius DSM 5150]|uniref:Fe2+/Zn2+ uptake regulation protein n=1 Tax=Halobacteroides halobius (strain ATCC 35273 / DSM 5150 / MD-1) TaxID=748449 RepID=L0K6X5_HALHC|nr:Fe2+/Zn2+ uptake regulation protein [Halobacteroides halobius DSM 5150]
MDNQEQHLSADDIYALVKAEGASVGLATIYRTLNLLESAEVVAKRDLGADSACYEFVFAESNQHHHLVCKKCGKVIETEKLLVADLKQRLLVQIGFQVVDCCVQIEGYCQNCR